MALMKQLYFAALFILFGCATPHNFSHETLQIQSYLQESHPLLHHTVMIIGAQGTQFSVCNGVYIGEGTVLTAGHCVVEGFSFFVFVPVQLKTKAPFTVIKLMAIEAKLAARHEKFTFEQTESLIQYDFAKLQFAPPAKSVLKPAVLINKTISLPNPSKIEWVSNTKTSSYFKIDPLNSVSISGFKVEKNEITQGLYQVNDAASIVGTVPGTQSILVSLNPGTNIHQGVSGSGLFYLHQGTYYLTGVVSHYMPGINLLAASDIREVQKWISIAIK